MDIPDAHNMLMFLIWDPSVIKTIPYPLLDCV